METEKKKLKRLVLNINEDDHHEIKRRALFKNITIRAWVSRAIRAAIVEEKKYE